MPIRVEEFDSSAVVTVVGSGSGAGATVRVTSSKSTVTINPGFPSAIHGETGAVWLEVKLNWNGGRNAPTVVYTLPTSWWGSSGSLDPKFSVYWDASWGGGVGSWVIQWTYQTLFGITSEMEVTAGFGQFDTLTPTLYGSGGVGGNEYNKWGFRLYLDPNFVTDVQPTDIAECIIKIRHTPI